MARRLSSPLDRKPPDRLPQILAVLESESGPQLRTVGFRQLRTLTKAR